MKLLVPARTYLVKFASVRYGSSIVVGRNEPFAHLCFAYLVLGRNRSDYARFLDESERYNDKLPLEVSNSLAFDFGARHVTPYTAVCINRALDQMFKAEFAMFVRQQLSAGAKIVQAIDAFRAEYGLCEEDIADETLKKILQRRNVWARKVSNVQIGRPLLQQSRQLRRA